MRYFTTTTHVVLYSACDNLRCMSCNFQVLIFQDCSWKTDPNIVNYMFFRNNMPNKQKLSVGLIEHHTIRKRANSSSSFSSSHIGYDLDLDEDILGEIATTRPNSGRGSNHSNSTLNSNSGPSGTAYCCQCSWVTVNQTEIDLKQVTGYVEGNPSHLKWICASH